MARRTWSARRTGLVHGAQGRNTQFLSNLFQILNDFQICDVPHVGSPSQMGLVGLHLTRLLPRHDVIPDCLDTLHEGWFFLQKKRRGGVTVELESFLSTVSQSPSSGRMASGVPSPSPNARYPQQSHPREPSLLKGARSPSPSHSVLYSWSE